MLASDRHCFVLSQLLGAVVTAADFANSGAGWGCQNIISSLSALLLKSIALINLIMGVSVLTSFSTGTARRSD